MNKYVTIGMVALVLAFLFLQGRSDAQAGRQADRREVVMQVLAYRAEGWITIDYRLRNASREAFEFEFRNSGRVCGALRGPAGEEVYTFPQVTAQVIGTEILEPNEELAFRYRVQPEELAGLEPGDYTVEAWLCGYEKLRDAAPVRLPAAD